MPWNVAAILLATDTDLPCLALEPSTNYILRYGVNSLGLHGKRLRTRKHACARSPTPSPRGSVESRRAESLSENACRLFLYGTTNAWSDGCTKSINPSAVGIDGWLWRGGGQDPRRLPIFRFRYWLEHSLIRSYHRSPTSSSGRAAVECSVAAHEVLPSEHSWLICLFFPERFSSCDVFYQSSASLPIAPSALSPIIVQSRREHPVKYWE